MLSIYFITRYDTDKIKLKSEFLTRHQSGMNKDRIPYAVQLLTGKQGFSSCYPHGYRVVKIPQLTLFTVNSKALMFYCILYV